jgi:hypothetical protein
VTDLRELVCLLTNNIVRGKEEQLHSEIKLNQRDFLRRKRFQGALLLRLRVNLMYARAYVSGSFIFSD